MVLNRSDIAERMKKQTIFFNQLVMCNRNNERSAITVISDDTDVFVLLLHYYHAKSMENHLTMESPVKERTVIDIEKTVGKHSF